MTPFHCPFPRPSLGDARRCRHRRRRHRPPPASLPPPFHPADRGGHPSAARANPRPPRPPLLPASFPPTRSVPTPAPRSCVRRSASSPRRRTTKTALARLPEAARRHRVAAITAADAAARAPPSARRAVGTAPLPTPPPGNSVPQTPAFALQPPWLRGAYRGCDRIGAARGCRRASRGGHQVDHRVPRKSPTPLYQSARHWPSDYKASALATDSNDASHPVPTAATAGVRLRALMWRPHWVPLGASTAYVCCAQLAAVCGSLAPLRKAILGADDKVFSSHVPGGPRLPSRSCRATCLVTFPPR